VVGAGPGGALAAYACARHGLRTILLEKEKLPRRKVCGGGVSAKALSVLPFSPQPAMEQRTVSGWVTYGSEQALEVAVPRPGMMVCRESFDAFLTEQAVAAGAKLTECFDLDVVRQNADTSTLVSRQRSKIEAQIVIAADGVNSAVRRQRFPDAHPRTVAALEARVVPAAWAKERLSDRCVFDFGAVEAGYGWIFPKRDHFNVGVYRFRKTAASRDLRAILARFLTETPFLREARILDVAGAMIPVSPGARSLVREGVILVGDAAGLGDPLYGEGIYSALQSGLDAAAAVVAHLAGDAPLAAYDDRVRNLRLELKAAALMAGFVYHFPRFAFERMAGSPYACRLFSGVITGEVSPTKCLLKASVAAPYWLLARRRRAQPLPDQ